MSVLVRLDTCAQLLESLDGFAALSFTLVVNGCRAARHGRRVVVQCRKARGRSRRAEVVSSWQTRTVRTMGDLLDVGGVLSSRARWNDWQALMQMITSLPEKEVLRIALTAARLEKAEGSGQVLGEKRHTICHTGWAISVTACESSGAPQPGGNLETADDRACQKSLD